MSSRRRIHELKALHSKISEGGNCFGPKALQRHLKKPLKGADLPQAIYEENFIEMFEEETSRLEELDKKLRENVEQYSIKRDLHREFFRHKSMLNDKGPNKLDIVIESGQDLSANESVFHIKKNGKVVYKSMVKTKTVNPVWNERYCVGIDTGDQVNVELINPQTGKNIGLVEFNLKTLEDQLVHCRGYELSKGKLYLRAQWTYNQSTFHRAFGDKYEHMVNVEEALLEKVSQKLNDMFTLSGDPLLQAWFTDEGTQRPQRVPKLRLNYESFPQTTVVSLVSTPNASTVATRYSRPVDLSEIIHAKGRTSKQLNRSRFTDFFSIGLYKGKAFNLYK